MDERPEAKVIYAAQVRAARALLNWSQGELAERAGVSKQSVNRIESGGSDARLTTLDALHRVLKSAGVEISEEPIGVVRLAIRAALLRKSGDLPRL